MKKKFLVPTFLKQIKQQKNNIRNHLGHKIVKDYIIDTNSYEIAWPVGGVVELLIHNPTAHTEGKQQT